MSQYTLERLIGTAVVDERFRLDFLNGGRKRLLAQFELDSDEREILLTIHSDSLEKLAIELKRWLEDREVASRSDRFTGDTLFYR